MVNAKDKDKEGVSEREIEIDTKRAKIVFKHMCV